ncbi:MAG: sensor histidine kinase [Cyclobacteriaceae bacterium]
MSEENIEMVQLGCLLFISAYHIILYFQLRRNYYLYLGLLSFTILVRALLVDDGSQLFFQLFSNVDRLVGRKIEYFVTFSSLFLMPMFIYDLYPNKRLRRYLRFFQLEGGALMLFVLLTPYYIFRETVDFFQLSMIASFAFTFLILNSAIKKKMIGAKITFFGILVSFGFVLIQMGKNSEIVTITSNGPNLISIAVVIYFFFQSIALSEIFAQSFRENEQLNKELEERVSTRTEQLSKSNLIKDRFLKIVSHDLRAPLGSLKSMLALLGTKSITEEQSNTLREKIGSSLTGSIDMLDDLLEWTKATSESKVQVRKERVNILELMQSTLALFEGVALRKNIELTLNSQKGSPVFVESDINVANVVLRNLINNAIKFTDENGHVKVGLRRKGKTVEVYTEDDGIGVPHEMKQSIFEMESKNRRSGTHNEKSTGVGLALCKDLILQNGGKIWVEDNVPKGTIFKFTLELSA